jgi:hypothetical protein
MWWWKVLFYSRKWYLIYKNKNRNMKKYRPYQIAKMLWIDVKDIYKAIDDHVIKVPLRQTNKYNLVTNYIFDDNDLDFFRSYFKDKCSK